MQSIEVADLWLSYRDKRVRPPALKLRLAGVGRKRDADRWALQGVSFEVEQGQMLGVVGHNGSGKSTLLRCLAGIFRPVRGSVTVRGRAASLIDLTAGFHRLLSARDNVLLAGAIYGIPRDHLLSRFDEMMEFAELTDEVDTPLRAFSTGMALRLGFAIAVGMEPDVLLVDEVLAVGDEAFKVKCLDKVGEMRRAGTTIVFVSHELAVVRMLCERTIVLEHGKILFEGESDPAIRDYCKHLGVDLDFALSRPLVEGPALERVEESWHKGGKARSR